VLGLPARLEIDDPPRHLAHITVPFAVAPHRERHGIDPERVHAGFRAKGVSHEPESLRSRVLEQAVYEDHVVPRQLFATAACSANELAVVNDELEVQLRGFRARIARAVRRVLDTPQAPAKAEVALLDRVEQHRRVELAVQGVAERGISFQLVYAQDGLEAFYDVSRDLRDHILGVLERAGDNVVAISGDIRDEKGATLDRGGHKPNCTPRLPWGFYRELTESPSCPIHGHCERG